MTGNKYIQLKAALLLIVFSLNTLVGFACSIGIDMGFNTKHHHDDEATEAAVHIHADGKKHVHQKEASKHHHQDETVEHRHSSNEKDNCCNDEVMKFQQVDKAVAPVFALSSPVFFAALLPSAFPLDFLSSNYKISIFKYFVRQHHPPIPDIRIAIQSFQI